MFFFSDTHIQKYLVDENKRQIAEEYLYAKCRHFVHSTKARAILPQEVDRLSAYHDAFLSTTSAISSGLYRGESSIKNFFWKIFYFKCVTLGRANATLKASIIRPGKEVAEDILSARPVDALASHETIFNEEDVPPFFEEFRRNHKKCYYLLVLYDASGLSAEDVLNLTKDQSIMRDDGMTQRLGELIEIENEASVVTTFSSVEALRMAASRCREKLRVFASEKLNLPHPHRHAK